MIRFWAGYKVVLRNYRYYGYKSIRKFRSIIDMDLSISIWIYRYRYGFIDIDMDLSISICRVSNLTCQSALRTLISIRPSVCLFVRPPLTPFLTMFLSSYHPEIVMNLIMLKLSVITIDRRDVHAKGQGQRPKVKVTEVMTPLNNFRTVTPV